MLRARIPFHDTTRLWPYVCVHIYTYLGLEEEHGIVDSTGLSRGTYTIYIDSCTCWQSEARQLHHTYMRTLSSHLCSLSDSSPATTTTTTTLTYTFIQDQIKHRRLRGRMG